MIAVSRHPNPGSQEARKHPSPYLVCDRRQGDECGLACSGNGWSDGRCGCGERARDCGSRIQTQEPVSNLKPGLFDAIC